jgi:hypothetical protein
MHVTIGTGIPQHSWKSFDIEVEARLGAKATLPEQFISGILREWPHLVYQTVLLSKVVQKDDQRFTDTNRNYTLRVFSEIKKPDFFQYL